jgi:hypothetical protein
MSDWIWVSCNFANEEKYLFCEECSVDALHHHCLEIDNDLVREVSGRDLSANSKCSHCNISVAEGYKNNVEN